MNRKVVKARQRLSLAAYQAIHALAEPWLQNAMDLALLTLQRRDDTARLQFTDIKDEHLYVIQQKTEKHGASAHIKIEIGSDLQKVIQRCRDDVLSPYLVHKVPERHVKTPKKSHYTQINGEYISKAFSAARDMTGLFDKMPAIERPTFHEIRSLGIKLYEDNGSNAQFLAGHTTRKMTEAYKQGHEIAWTPAIANLTLPAPQ
jgi:integrase